MVSNHKNIVYAMLYQKSRRHFKKKNCSLVLWTIENGDAYETEYIKLLNTHQQTTVIYVIKPKL